MAKKMRSGWVAGFIGIAVLGLYAVVRLYVGGYVADTKPGSDDNFDVVGWLLLLGSTVSFVTIGVIAFLRNK